MFHRALLRSDEFRADNASGQIEAHSQGPGHLLLLCAPSDAVTLRSVLIPMQA
jgi:hypothetical protein